MQTLPSPFVVSLLDDMNAVSPALAHFTSDTLLGDVWSRPDLSARDRSIVTVSALISRNTTVGLLHYLNVALDSGVAAAELSELITHLAFYAGWPNAVSAVGVTKEVFASRGIGAEQLPPSAVDLLPLDEATEANRETRVEANFGKVAPGVLHYTTNVLFRNLWLRPHLAPRDRSLVTVTALVATSQVAQITYHLNRAMDNGLTRAEAAEVLAHLAFYVGWPNVFSAMPIVKDVFESRAG